MPKALIIPFPEKYEKYTVEFWHNGRLWEFEIYAKSIRDAEIKLESLINTAIVVGKYDET